MRIFVVKDVCAGTEMYQILKGADVSVVKEFDHFYQAMNEAGATTEDNISVIILNTVREEGETKKSENNNQRTREKKVLQIRTFGNFEVFYKGTPMAFSRAKSKELFAYLIDRRGAGVTTAEACSILWEDKEYNFSRQRQFQTVVSELIKSLKMYNCDHIIHRRRNCLAVDASGVDCDFYKLMAGDKLSAEQYNGEYMSNYSWAEMTAGFLAQKYGNFDKI